MQRNFIFIFLLFFFALRAEAAMVRVVGVENGRTLTIERDGTRVSVRLAGVAIVNELCARELLRWSAGSSWVMLEESETKGEYLVYRSPDARMLNRELVQRGCATATLPDIAPRNRAPVTYLGMISGERGSRTGNDSPSRPRATPSPRPRARRTTAGAAR